MCWCTPILFFDEGRHLFAVYSILTDITAHKENNEKHVILSAIVESSDDAIISKTLDGTITSWNAGAQRIFGYTEQEAIGKHISLLIPSNLLDEEEHIIEHIRSGKKIDHFQTTRISKSGKEIPISLTVSPVKNYKGEITGASKIARDISDQRQKEQAIAENTRRLEILNSISKSISEKLDAESIMQRVTHAAADISRAAFAAFLYYSQPSGDQNVPLVYATPRLSGEAVQTITDTELVSLFHPVVTAGGVVRMADIRRDPEHIRQDPLLRLLPYASFTSYMAVPLFSNTGAVTGGLFFAHPEEAVFSAEQENMIIHIVSMAAVALDNTRLFEDINALNKKKDEFIALASHELKTPLTTLSGYLQLLERTNQDENGTRFLQKSLQQVNKLNNLITDLLDVAKIEAGKLMLNREVFDLAELSAEIAENYNHLQKTHRIEMITSPSEPLLVYADRQRIEQVLINFLSNAVKYSPGQHHVDIRLTKDPFGAAVIVEDKGMGLSQADQQQLFTRFYRAGDNPSIPGLGIGLYLCKEIIERHNGRIGVESEPGKGAAFYFTLPLTVSTIEG